MVNSSPMSMESEGRDHRLVDAAQFAATSRLVDSLLHEARNPLNALSINLGVLTQKLRKDAEGEVPATQEKNLRAMREQVARVDEILRLFAEFLSPRDGNGEINFSDFVQRALAVLGHEGRAGRVELRSSIDPQVKVLATRVGALHFLALQPILRAIARSAEGSEVLVTLERQDSTSVFRVHDSGSHDREPFPDAPAAMEAICEQLGGHFQCRGAELTVVLPLP